MEIYNKFTDTSGYCNAYITCTSTEKAAVYRLYHSPYSTKNFSIQTVAHQYRVLFKFVKLLIIDEISMVGAELLHQIDSLLKQISVVYNTNYGGFHIILIGDLWQLPPVMATLIYKKCN